MTNTVADNIWLKKSVEYLSEEFLDYFNIDTRGIFSPKSYSWPSDPKEDNDSFYFLDHQLPLWQNLSISSRKTKEEIIFGKEN